MPEITVEGGHRLRGTVGVCGAKNAALKEMVAAILAPGRHELTNVPQIDDVSLMGDVLTHLGCHVRRENGSLWLVTPEELIPEAPLELVRRMRASFVVLGPLLARCGVARVALPGGDDLGARPIDMHIEGLEQMGASFRLVHGVLEGEVEGGLVGADIELSFPSVGATENLMLAAVLAKGETSINNAAHEPEITDLAEHLVSMGAAVTGAGTPIIHIEGTSDLSPARHRVIPDRVEAGTYAVAAAITGGDVTVTGCIPTHLRMELAKLEEGGCEVERGDGWLRVHGPERPKPVDFATLPYPGFHTDMHPQMVALLTIADGTSIVTENLYDGRFRYAGELARMGADIRTESQHAVIRGVRELSGCPVLAPDIRAGAALVLAGLRAEGVTVVGDAHHIDRGYEDLVGKLRISAPPSIGVTSSVPTRVVAAILATTSLAATTAQTVPPSSDPSVDSALFADRIEVVAPEGALLRIGDDLFAGPLVILPRGDGVTVIEALSPEEYLLGIREVPFAWPDEALKTQAVAARTYLAYNLAGGRTATGREHGYDICATTACQVYAGVAGLSSPDGLRWQQAVAATAGEILLYNGSPAQTLYSSTAGRRTRESEDIFPGLDVPYLAAVDSPGEDSPFVRWSFAVSAREMESLLDHAGMLSGPLESIRVKTTGDGGGPWEVVVASGGSQESVDTYRFRSLINAAARDLMPHKLPADRPDGRRYPQTVLSGTFTIRTDTEMSWTTKRGPVWSPSRFVIQGEGWGHQVGMSQYGALAMANKGSGYSDILAHYYGGLRPESASTWLPPEVLVGLVIGAEEIVVTAEQGASVLVDGGQVAPVALGIWRFRRDGGAVTTTVPVGLDTRPEIVDPRITHGPEGYVVRFKVSAPGYVQIELRSGGERVGGIDLGLVEAGDFEYPLYDLRETPFDLGRILRVGITTDSPRGGEFVSLPIVRDAR